MDDLSLSPIRPGTLPQIPRELTSPALGNSDLRSSYELRRGDIVAIRGIVAMEAVATVLFWFVHRYADPTAVDPLWQRVALAGLCLALVLLTYVAHGRTVARSLYVLYYGYTVWVIQLLARNDFHPDYAVGAMVVLASVSLGFMSFGPLRWYLFLTMTGLGLVLWSAPPTGVARLDPMLYVAYLGLFSAIGYLTMRGRLQAQEKLAASRSHYALAATATNDGLWNWDLATGRVFYSPRWREMLGLENDDVEHTTAYWMDRVHPDDARRVQADLVRHWSGDTPTFASEYRIARADGQYAWMLARGLAMRDDAGKPRYMAGSQTDITERKRTEQQLLHDALHDALTGLPNRALFLDRLEQVFSRCHRHPESGFAVIFVDLDRFKVINDSLGHAAGDELLIAVTRRLQSCIRGEDTVARLGGDEFAIVVADLPGESELGRIASRILAEIAMPVWLRGREVVTTASLGIAIGPGDYPEAEEVLRDADLAMYRAKSQGPGQSVVFDQAMQARTLVALDMETDLRLAIEHGELRLQYQPIVSMPSRDLTGFEALVRWDRPGHGILPPGEFIPLAEQTGLIVSLGRWVLHEACRQMKEWQDRAPSPVPLAINVNVSGRQLTHPDFVADVLDALRTTGLPAEHLRLELTESVLLSEPDSALSVLAKLRDLGVEVHLDDFGTGYSSFSYLHRFPIDAVKIDRSFVHGLDSNPRNAAIVRTLVILADTLGVSVLAEGVETDEEFDHLREIDCPAGQGFLFAPPLDPSAALEMMRSAIEAGELAHPV